MRDRVITIEDMPMTNVVYVDFHHRCKTAQPYPVPDYFMERFKLILRDMELVEDDIEEVVAAIKNPQLYAQLDLDLQRIVDVYHTNTQGLFQ
jgi:hypothetical protein